MFNSLNKRQYLFMVHYFYWILSSFNEWITYRKQVFAFRSIPVLLLHPNPVSKKCRFSIDCENLLETSNSAITISSTYIYVLKNCLQKYLKMTSQKNCISLKNITLLNN